MHEDINVNHKQTFKYWLNNNQKFTSSTQNHGYKTRTMPIPNYLFPLTPAVLSVQVHSHLNVRLLVMHEISSLFANNCFFFMCVCVGVRWNVAELIKLMSEKTIAINCGNIKIKHMNSDFVSGIHASNIVLQWCPTSPNTQNYVGLTLYSQCKPWPKSRQSIKSRQ